MALSRTWYNTLVDDSGAGTDGSIIAKADIDSLMDAVDAVLGAIDDQGALSFAASSTLTIATGVVTVTAGNNVFALDTEAAAASDDLDTITLDTNGRACRLLILKAANVARVVTVKHGTGNIQLKGGSFAMNDANHRLMLYRDGSTWYELARPLTQSDAVIQTTTLTGAQADFAATAARRLVLRCNNATLLTLSGFAAGTDGDEITLESVGAGQVDLAHQNSGSTAANRLINCATSGSTSLAAGVGTARYVYDGTTARWRLVQHEQGTWIAPAYAAGDFTGNGSMTWTVDAGDVTVYRYWLKGRTLWVAWTIVTTTVGGTPNTELRIKVPGGFSVAFQATTAYMFKDNGGVWSFAAVWAESSVPTQIRLFVAGFGTTNWTASTNATHAYGQLAIEVG